MLLTLLLQAAEATKAATEAAGAVAHHANEAGPMTALLWLLVLLLGILTVLFYLKSDKASRTRTEACEAAVAAARVEWAKQTALDNGHAADLLRQSREQERDALDRLDRINHELRQQDKESVKVIGAVSTALGNLNAILQGVQFQLVTIETLLTGRPAQPPRLPVTPPAPAPLS